MRKCIVSAALWVGLCAAPASAQLVPLYESFDYPAGQPLSSTTGGATPVYTGQVNPGADGTVGTSDDRAWAATGASTTDDPVISPGSLAVPPGLAPSRGNSAAYGGTGNGSRISIGVVNSGTVWFSLAMNATNFANLQANTAAGNIVGGFNTLSGGQATVPGVIAPRIFLRQGTAADTFQIGVSKNSSTIADITYEAMNRPIGTPVFLVGSYEFVGAVGTDDQVKLFVNPTSLGGDAPTTGTILSASSGSDVSTGNLQSFLLRQSGVAGQTSGIVVDEVRVDSTYAAVTVPEPAGLAAGLGLLGLLARRRPRN